MRRSRWRVAANRHRIAVIAEVQGLRDGVGEGGRDVGTLGRERAQQYAVAAALAWLITYCCRIVDVHEAAEPVCVRDNGAGQHRRRGCRPGRSAASRP